MQVTELSAEGLKRQFKIVVPAGDLSAKVDERLAELAKTAQMPGFRQGKVPVGLLKKQYGQALFGEALEQAVNSSTAKAIEDRGLKPAMQPRVDLKTLEEGKDVEFEVVIEVLPEIGKLDFSEVELERLKAVVPEKDVEDAIGRIAKANREQKPVDPPRPAQKGDAIKLDFVGSVDGKEFKSAAELQVRAADGTTRAARADEYRVIRWTYKTAFAPGATAFVQHAGVQEHGAEKLPGIRAIDAPIAEAQVFNDGGRLIGLENLLCYENGEVNADQ